MGESALTEQRSSFISGREPRDAGTGRRSHGHHLTLARTMRRPRSPRLRNSSPGLLISGTVSVVIGAMMPEYIYFAVFLSAAAAAAPCTWRAGCDTKIR